MSPLRAGAARVKLDPPGGLAMLGYGGRVGPNEGVHDDLAAQALVLDDGAQQDRDRRRRPAGDRRSHRR